MPRRSGGDDHGGSPPEPVEPVERVGLVDFDEDQVRMDDRVAAAGAAHAGQDSAIDVGPRCQRPDRTRRVIQAAGGYESAAHSATAADVADFEHLAAALVVHELPEKGREL